MKDVVITCSGRDYDDVKRIIENHRLPGLNIKIRKRRNKKRKRSISSWEHEQAKEEYRLRKIMVQGGLPSLGKRR
jgi:hypothetical protein